MYEGRGMKAVVARLALLAVPALLTRVDFAATRSSPQTGAAHPEAGSCRTLGTANKQAVPHRRATPVYSAGEKRLFRDSLEVARVVDTFHIHADLASFAEGPQHDTLRMR